MKKNQIESEYTEAEAQARFEKTLRAALNTPPKPLKEMPKKRGLTEAKPQNSRPKLEKGKS